MVDHVGELLGEEPEVEGVEHPSGARDGEVRLEMAGAVPRQRGHRGALGDAQMVEGVHELAGPRPELAVGVALDGALG